MSKSKILLPVILGCAAFTSAGVQAAALELQNDITISGNSTVNWSNDLSSSNMSTVTTSGSTTQMMGSFNMDGVWDYNWNLSADSDPFIAGSFSITNTSTVTQSFDINFSLPVSPSFVNGYQTGSLSGSFMDANGDGSASLSLNDWSGLIDGATAMNLFSYTGPCFGSGCSTSIGTVSNGPLYFSGPVNSTIGIHMLFDLSAGDSVTFDTSYEVTPVPIPATLWLLGSGLIGMAGFIRKRNARA